MEAVRNSLGFLSRDRDRATCPSHSDYLAGNLDEAADTGAKALARGTSIYPRA